jgi:hypothetical protein
MKKILDFVNAYCVSLALMIMAISFSIGMIRLPAEFKGSLIPRMDYIISHYEYKLQELESRVDLLMDIEQTKVLSGKYEN